MRNLGMALAMAAGLLLTPLAAHAQKAKPADAAAAPAKITKEQRDRGAKEAPALLQAAGSQCKVADAYYVGQGDGKTTEGKTVKQTVYEVACQVGMGYVVISEAGKPKPTLYDCLSALGGNLKCQLPGNADPKQGLATYVQAAGRTCAISDARYIGTTPDGTTYYEVACGSALGFRMGVPASGAAPAVNDCLQVLGSQNACTLQDKGAVLAAFAPTVAPAGKTCQISDARFIGASAKTGEQYIEVGCGASPGYVAVLDSAGKYKSAIDCGKANFADGGCRFTDTTVAQSQETGAYTRLSQKAGFPCDVAKYRFIGTDAQNREVVELACKNRPDGAVAVFAETGKSDIYDCVRAGALGASAECKLSDRSAIYSKYNASLVAKGKGTCKVSDARWIGRTSTSDYVETACSDGLPGWVIELTSGTETAASLLSCRQASAAGVACKLPANLSGNAAK